MAGFCSRFSQKRPLGSAFASQHYSVEPVVILKPVKHRQTEAVAVKPQKPIEVVAGPCDPKYRSVHDKRVRLAAVPSARLWQAISATRRRGPVLSFADLRGGLIVHSG